MPRTGAQLFTKALEFKNYVVLTGDPPEVLFPAPLGVKLLRNNLLPSVKNLPKEIPSQSFQLIPVSSLLAFELVDNGVRE